MIQIAISLGLLVLLFLYTLHSGKKKRENFMKMLDKLAIGKEVITVGGIHGTVNKVAEETVEIRIDKGVSLTVSKGSIAWVEE